MKAKAMLDFQQLCFESEAFRGVAHGSLTSLLYVNNASNEAAVENALSWLLDQDLFLPQ
jgi:hypothetical protein